MPYKNPRAPRSMAMVAWHAQLTRCNNKFHPTYKHYGAKGIRVLYGREEFIEWWIQQQSKLNLKRPTVSRMDHDKHYSLDNIKLEEFNDNCVVDVMRRHGPVGNKRSRAVVMLNIQMEVIGTFKSQREASRALNIPQPNISLMCLGGAFVKKSGTKKWVDYKATRDGVTFRFAADWENRDIAVK